MVCAGIFLVYAGILLGTHVFGAVIDSDSVNDLQIEVINDTIVGHSCQLGTYSTNTAADSGDCSGYRLCEPGYYCTLDYERLQCPGGTFGADSGLFTEQCSGLCAAGYYCPIGSTSNTQFPCGGDDVYCPEGSSEPIPVSSGYYTIEGAYTEDGWANLTRTKQVECPQGHFCVGGVRFGCPPGTFNSGFGQTTCDESCPEGYYCPLGSIEPRPCEDASAYCPAGSSRPLVVQPRYYATSSPSAHVRGANLTSAQALCPPGSYCIDGIKYACPAGRYGNVQGEVDPLCSGVCEEGFYCPEGSTRPTQIECGDVDVYCPEGSSMPTPVDVGFYSIGGDSDTTRTDQEQCQPGYWCEAGTRQACFAGHYGSEYGMSSGNCSGPCDAGFFCGEQSTTPTQNVCGGTNVFCPVGSVNPTQVSPGHYTVDPVDGGGFSAERLCGIGRYCQNGTELECLPGYYGSSFGLTEPTCDGPCDAGYFCTSGSTLPTQNLCGGYDVYCPQASNATTPVEDGFYTINLNSAAGEAGISGTDGQTQSAQTQCEPGYFCKNGVKRSCPAGTFGSEAGLTSFECSGVCSAGYYCPPASVSATEVPCGSTNVWCPEGSALPTPVSDGYYTMPEEDVVVVHRSSAETCFTDAVWKQVWDIMVL